MKGSTRKRGSTWSYYFSIPGEKGTRKKIEKGGFRTKKDAEKALAQAMAEYDNNGLVLRKSDLTFKQVYEMWMETKKIRWAFTTLEVEERTFRHINEDIGELRVQIISPIIIQRYINTLSKTKTRNIVKRYLSRIKQVLEYAVYPLQIIRDNPAKRATVETTLVRPKSNRTLTKEDVQHLFEKSKGTCFYIPVRIAYYTGMRVGEICGLTWDRVDLKNGTITVDRAIQGSVGEGRPYYHLAKPKTETSNRTIYIGKKLTKILEDERQWQLKAKLLLGAEWHRYYLHGDLVKPDRSSEELDFVCRRSEGQLVRKRSVSTLVSHCGYTMHSLRHTHATQLVESGAPIKGIQDRLGHKDVETTLQIYAGTTEKMSRDTAEIFERDSLG